ncbi:MAG: DNA-protecting protein DprA [Deltaproteobacteria bacterium]|nr:DNA-protecting protein DprA [Deltaproteobacteria bacterium]
MNQKQTMTDSERTARLALALSEGIGPVRGKILLDVFGSAGRALAARAGSLQERAGLPAKVAANLGRAWQRALIELKRLTALGGWVIVRGDDNYPELLAQIPDPPLALFGLGRLQAGDSQALAVVGSRQATDYGRRTTHRLARELAGLGICVVSGLAVGIDTAAHEGALTGGGRTIAVLGCGLDVDYPLDNVGLKRRIADQGAVLTEYPLGTKPHPGIFVGRNRIIAGLVQGVVVAEASPRSGALITAGHALDFGRTVMAVPGPLTDRRREGTHALIRQGAILVTSGREAAAEMWPQDGQPSLFDQEHHGDGGSAPEPSPELQGEAAAIYSLLEASPRHIDELIRQSGLPSDKVQVVLLELELEGLVRQLPGQQFVKH